MAPTLRWAWRQLTSMRTALTLLLLLAIAAVPGSVLPQRRIDPGAVRAYLAGHRTSGPWLDRVGMFDVYSSAWFAAIYLLLFVSLVGCVLPRSRRHLLAVRARPPRTPRVLSRLPVHATAELDAPAGDVLDRARAELARRRFRVAEHDAGRSIAAEKGYTAETGNLVFHLALLVLLVGMAAGSLYGYSGQAVVVVGEDFTNTLPAYDSFTPGSRVNTQELPPYWLRLDDLTARFEADARSNQFGAPREFTAAVTVHRPGRAARRTTLKPNQPLDVAGARMFLVGNGYAPVLTVRDGQGQVAFSGPVPFPPRDGAYTSRGVVKAPDARPRQIGLIGDFLPTAATGTDGQPTSIFPGLGNPLLVLGAYTGDLGLDDGTPQSVYVLDTARMSVLKQPDGRGARLQLAPGQTVSLPGGNGSVSFDGVRRFAAFDVRYDPAKIWVLLAAITALAGLMMSLFVRRRRLWVRVLEADGHNRVEVGALAPGDDERLSEEVAAVLAAITSAFPGHRDAVPQTSTARE